MAECPGVYRLSQMRDGAMARIRVPGGEVTGEQVREIADIARIYGNGLIDLTNRANLQVRGLSGADAPNVAGRLRDVDLLCESPDTDRLRNITASPLAGLDPTEIIDVRPCVEVLDEVVRTSAAMSALSVKFSFVLDGGGQGDLGSIGHDIGFIAAKFENDPVFEVRLAGAQTGQGVMPNDLGSFAACALKFVRDAEALRMRDALVQHRAGTAVQTIAKAADVPIVPVLSAASRLPLTLGYGASWLAIGVPLSRLTAQQLAGLADLCERSSETLRLTPWQAIVIPHASPDLADEAKALGFDIEDPAIRIVACAGATGCERTVADTKADGLRLRNRIGDMKRANGEPLTIHLSGCPRGCAMPGESDILALAEPESANYALHAGSRPSTANAAAPNQSNVAPAALAEALRGMIG